MATEFKVRRGTTAEHAAFTGAEGEITLDTNKDTLVVHDNYQAGGYPMLREDLNNLTAASIGIDKIAYGSPGQFLKTNATGNALEFATVKGVEIFKYSGDVGGVSDQSYVPGTLTFTPTNNCFVALGWSYSYRHSSATHAYWEPRLLTSADGLLEQACTFGGAYSVSASSHNNGIGSVVNFNTQLTGGTTYKLRIYAQNLGASVSAANDIGNDLHLTAFCMPV